MLSDCQTQELIRKLIEKTEKRKITWRKPSVREGGLEFLPQTVIFVASYAGLTVEVSENIACNTCDPGAKSKYSLKISDGKDILKLLDQGSLARGSDGPPSDISTLFDLVRDLVNRERIESEATKNKTLLKKFISALR